MSTMMSIKTLMTMCVVVAGCVIIVNGKVYERCELARELRDLHEIPDSQLATWVCIARHESEYNTSAINRGSGDHGLLQISELFWCSPPGYACGVSCDDLRNDDIEDDVICARRVYREHKRLSGDGFNAWVVYGSYCRDKHYANTFLEGCFKPGELKTSSKDILEKPLPTVNYYPHISWKTTTVSPTITKQTIESETTEKTTSIEITTSTKLTTTSKPTRTTSKPIKFTKTSSRFTTTTLKPTYKPIKVSRTTPTAVTTPKQPKPSILTTKKHSAATPVATVQVNKEGKPLRPTEENDEFTYAISKTGYKFTRF